MRDPREIEKLKGTRKWYWKHIDRTRLIGREKARRLRKEKRQEVVRVLGGKCVKCGFSDIRALQIDHINGGGTKELKEFYSMGKIKYYKSIIENELRNNKYQLLCANCNWIKRFENNEFGGNEIKPKEQYA
jgi:hypothetical protein